MKENVLTYHYDIKKKFRKISHQRPPRALPEGLGLLISIGGLLLLLALDFEEDPELLAGLLLLRGRSSLSIFLAALTGIISDFGLVELERNSFIAISFALSACFNSAISLR